MGSVDFDRKRGSGQFPQYGAIFMSDYYTRKECFKRKIFGLPINLWNFVKEVKVGMLLFLFDHQERKLYGVFEATTDGAMNIVPYAYKSSGMNFPAQVQFQIIWHCYPIPEEIFHEAIKENYFTPRKFHFGLSRNQVKMLVHMFENKRIKTKINQSLMPKTKADTCYGVTEPSVECQPESVSITEPSRSFMSEKPESLCASDVGPGTSTRTDLTSEDFIPLASSEDEESQSPTTDELTEVCSGVVQDFTDFSGTLCETQEGGDKVTENGSGCKVKGLYSDFTKERTSAFHRLSGLSKSVNESKGSCDKKVKDTWEILRQLDKICDERKIKNVKRACPSYGDRPSKRRKSVFSRIRNNDV